MFPQSLRVTTLYSLAFFALLPLPAAAEDENSEEAVVVIADRVAKPLNEIGSSVSVLDEADIETRQEQTVFELLQSLPGIEVTRNGGLGSVFSVRIRGAEIGQTLVLIDGVKVNDLSSPDGAFNFANLTADAIERIEVLRGPQSTLYGSDAIGGVINIITKKADEPFSLSGLFEGGSFGTFRGGATLGVHDGGFRGTLSLTGFRTEGISAASAARGNPERDGFRTLSAILNLSQEITEGLTLDGFFRFADSRAEFDTFDFFTFLPTDGDGVTDSRDYQGALGATWTALGGKLENRAQVSWSAGERFDAEFGAPSFNAMTRNRTVDLLSTLRVAPRLTLLLGGQHQRHRIVAESFGAFPSFQQSQVTIASVFGEVVAEPVTGFHVTLGVRRDDHQTFGGHTTFRVTGVYEVRATGTLIRANWGEGFKAPTLFQLFSDFGNPALLPEESRGWEAGVEHAFFSGRLRAGVAYFQRSSVNQIDFDFGTFKYGNIAGTRAKGVEVIAAADITPGLSVSANYTRLDAVNALTGMALTRRPKNVVNAEVVFRPDARWTLSSGLHFTGQKPDAGVILAGYAVLDIRAAYRLNERIEVYGRIENAFDADYEVVLGFGTPGIAAFGGLRGTF